MAESSCLRGGSREPPFTRFTVGGHLGMLGMVLPGICRVPHHPVYASFPPPSRCTRLHPAGRCRHVRTGEHELTRRDDSYFRVVEEERPLGRGKRSFSPQEITSFSQETALKRPTNPLQKAGAHKDSENLPTPPGMTRRPPQGYRPPFSSRTATAGSPAPGSCPVIKCSEKCRKCPSGHPIVAESARKGGTCF